jgi:hypothetical protein
MSKKRKREQQFVITTMGFVALILIIGLGMFVITLTFNKSADEATFIPTAQFLEQHPLEAPTFIHINQDCVNSSHHCFRIKPETLVGRDDGFVFNDMVNRLPSLAVKVDDKFVATHAYVNGSVIYGDIPIAQLSDGLHLVEVTITDIQGNILSHSWAMRLGDATSAAVPTVAVPPTHVTPTP